MSHVKTVVTLDAIKGLARRLKSELKAEGAPKKHTDCLNLAARSFGYRDWHACEGHLADHASRMRQREPRLSSRVRELSDRGFSDWILRIRDNPDHPRCNLDVDTRLDGNIIAHLCTLTTGFDAATELSGIATLMSRAARARGVRARVVDMSLFAIPSDEDHAWVSAHIGSEYRNGGIERSGTHQNAVETLYEALSEVDGYVTSTGTELIVVASMFDMSSKPYFRRLLALGERARVRFLLYYQLAAYHVPFRSYMSGESPWSGVLGRPVTNLHRVEGGVLSPSLKETRIRVRRGDMTLAIAGVEGEGLTPPTALSILERGGLITHLRNHSINKTFRGASDFFVDAPDLPILHMGHDFRPSSRGYSLWSRLTGAPVPSGGVEGLLSALASSRTQNGGVPAGLIWVNTSAESARPIIRGLNRVRDIVNDAGIRLVLSFWDDDLEKSDLNILIEQADGWLIDAGSSLPVCDSVFPGGFGMGRNATGEGLALRSSDIAALLAEPDPATI